MRYVAIVVSYNRRETLREVLKALLGQSRPLDGVLVVDNCSTDGSRQLVLDEFPQVALFEPESNLGGAGGFAWGVELSLALGFDAAWLMDDDAIPQVDAFERLLEVGERPLWMKNLGFLCSSAVSPGGDPGDTVGNPAPSQDFARQFYAVQRGTLAVEHASFLGFLVNLHVAALEPLPYPDFFIWCDDVEYSSRLASAYGGLCVVDSKIIHRSPAMQALVGGQGLGWKFRYYVRNRLWLVRWGLPEASRLQRAAQIVGVLRATKREWQDHPTARLALTTASAWAQGIFRRPAPHPVGSLLEASSTARRWVEACSLRGSREYSPDVVLR